MVTNATTCGWAYILCWFVFSSPAMSDVTKEAFVQSIEKLGGEVAYDLSDPPEVGGISFKKQNVTEPIVTQLCSLNEERPIRGLGLVECDIDGAMFSRLLSSLTKLEYLTVFKSKVAQPDFSSLTKSKRLESLMLEDLNVVLDKGAASGVSQLTKLKMLGLSDTRVAPSAVPLLGKLRALTWLNLGGTGVSDAAMVHVSKLRSLETLLLHGNRISSAGVHHLTSLKQLKTLRLEGAGVTDDAAEQLARIASLEHLSLSDTQLSPSGLQKLLVLPRLRELEADGPHISEADEDLAMLYLPANRERFAEVRGYYERTGELPVEDE